MIDKIYNDVDREEIKKILARRSHLRFMQYTWQTPFEPFQIGLHTKEICYKLDEAMENYCKGISTFLVMAVPFRHGKALEVNTPIPTPQGWKKIGELEVGNYVFSPNGKQVKVIAKSPVWKNRKLVKVDVDSGRDTIYCDEKHLWKCKRDRRQKNFKVYDAKTLCKHSRSARQVELSKPLDLAEKELLVAPYVLGLWLGDGHSDMGYITAGKEDIKFEREFVESCGYITSEIDSRKDLFLIKGLLSQLKKIGVYKNKHIPVEYLRASYKQRFELLQGLIDSDGDVHKKNKREGKNFESTGGQVTFTNKNKTLAENVCELVRSLGVKCSISEFTSKLYGKDCGIGYKVSFYLKDCARLGRKAERTRNSEKFNSHALRFEQTEIIGDTVCIQVENADGMFLCGKSFTPTHNSQIISRYFPPHFLGEFPDNEVMLVAYASSLAEDFSKYARELVRSPEYAELYPDTQIKQDESGVQVWGIQDHFGKFRASGLSSGITGKGYHLGICDDYCASRLEAESETQREGMWQHFKDDFMSRRAPVSITIVLATPWHIDDIIGRIAQITDPENEKYEPDFPPFEILRFPAKNGEVKVHEKDNEKYGDYDYHETVVKYNYLFPERFNEQWYKQQFASLGDYSSSALLQCQPVSQGGNLLRVDRVNIIKDLKYFPNIKYYRVWDLAHTEKQTQKSDPDWTRGTLLAYQKVFNPDGTYFLKLWIKDVAGIRANAPERNNFIRAVAEKDGQSVTIAVENSIESKDAYNEMVEIFRGRRLVLKIDIKGDKIARMSPVEPIFEAGNVFVYQGEFLLDWLKEAKEFPSGKHDDQMDNLSAGYIITKQQQGQIITGGVSGL